jgi:hypothetical protein
MMRITRIGRVLGSGWWRTLTVSAAALAAVGVLGAVPPAAASASPQQALDWTNPAPAVHPSPRVFAAMAYDAATGTVVLFGGYTENGDPSSFQDDTWTWNGTTWTEQHPATSPPARFDAAMAYDAATGTVVLFGGMGLAPDNYLGDTWTWNGTTWTEQHPATSPTHRTGGRMVYDAATGTVVLFGGGNNHGALRGTWTWDGTNWTKQAAASPGPLFDAAMAYDAATGTVVLFGPGDDTWTWDGTTWTKQAPAAHPGPRDDASMAYDAATGTVVLFGGYDGTNECLFDGTWTWDGTTWTKQAPATHPSPRAEASMAYDAATGTAVLFGGDVPTTRCASSTGNFFGQTWIWG